MKNDLTKDDLTIEQLKAAADEACRQAEEGFVVLLDPDVADYMGAFEETALSLADVEEDSLHKQEDEDE